mmetsp:Transcript_20964/g.31636  ORF Transcript_20964/g.31636 Transcript_20964/m.31636 type:complete len:151 (+) Transcript_20964:237-689(+)
MGPANFNELYIGAPNLGPYISSTNTINMGFFFEYSNSFDNKLNKNHTQKLRKNVSEKKRRHDNLRLQQIIRTCTTKIMEPPISRDEAISRMDNSSSFRQAVYEKNVKVMVPELVHDDIDRAVQLDYTARLKQCIQQQREKERRRRTTRNF